MEYNLWIYLEFKTKLDRVHSSGEEIETMVDEEIIWPGAFWALFEQLFQLLAVCSDQTEGKNSMSTVFP